MSSALISSVIELDDLEDAFFLAGSLVGVVFFLLMATFSEVLLSLTCPRI